MEVKRIAIALAASLLASTFTANAADISGKRMDDGLVVIQITGKINPMDGVKFVALTQNLTSDDKVLVSLDSTGGAVAAGLTIGYRIHNNDWETMVMGDNICASACADIWLAGSTRYFTDKGQNRHALVGDQEEQENGPRRQQRPDQIFQPGSVSARMRSSPC